MFVTSSLQDGNFSSERFRLDSFWEDLKVIHTPQKTKVPQTHQPTGRKTAKKSLDFEETLKGIAYISRPLRSYTQTFSLFQKQQKTKSWKTRMF